MDKLALIRSLMELVEEEQKYKQWYEYQVKMLNSHKEERHSYSYNLHHFYTNNRTPNNANIKDALRIIGRLGFQLAKEGEVK